MLMTVRNLLEDLDIDAEPIAYSDSTAALAQAGTPFISKRSRHLELRWHYLKQLVDDGKLALEKIHTDVQPADMLTKPLTYERIVDLSHKGVLKLFG